MALSRLQALSLLNECDGDHIWSVEHCRLRGVPEDWIAELVDGFESGFNLDEQTIYYKEQKVSQFEGLRDYDLALRLAKFLNIRLGSSLELLPTRRAIVQAIKEKFEEG
jgi:hypothetical protein